MTSAPDPSAPAPEPKKSPYARMGENTSVRNVVWALGLTVAVVAVVAMLFFGVGNDPQRSVPASERVDVAASARRAQELAPFPVVVPRTGQGWTAKEARFLGQGEPRWRVRYSAPSGTLVTLTQVRTVTPGLLQDTLPGARSQGSVTVGSTQCEVFAGQDEASKGGKGEAPTALSCPAGSSAVLVSGTAPRSELTALAAAALQADAS